jgi:hypothetical protein
MPAPVKAKRPAWLTWLRFMAHFYAVCTAMYVALYPFASVPVGTKLGPGASVVDGACYALFHVVAAPIYGGLVCERAWYVLVDWLRIVYSFACRALVSLAEHAWQLFERFGEWLLVQGTAFVDLFDRVIIGICHHVIRPFLQHMCLPVLLVCWHCLVAVGQWLQAAYGVCDENVRWFFSLCWDWLCAAAHVVYPVLLACRAYAEGVYERMRALGAEMAMHASKHVDAIVAAAWQQRPRTI